MTKGPAMTDQSGGHTPGPLQVVEGCEIWDTRGDGAPGISLVKADLGLYRQWGRAINSEEVASNLKLFAAAPDLLAACEAMMARWPTDQHEGSPRYDEAVAMRAAITLATGAAS